MSIGAVCTIIEGVVQFIPCIVILVYSPFQGHVCDDMCA